MIDNRKISELSGEDWKKVRIKYHQPNSPMNRENAAKVLFEFDDIMSEIGAPYFLSCGTALGFRRDGNFIEWDDEIDIDLKSEEFMPRFLFLKEKFLENGFIVRPTLRNNGSKMNIFKNKIKIAMSSLSLIGESRIYSNQKVPGKLYERPDKIEYLGREFNLPGPSEEYLTWYYGDWETVIKSYDPSNYVNKNIWR